MSIHPVVHVPVESAPSGLPIALKIATSPAIAHRAGARPADLPLARRAMSDDNPEVPIAAAPRPLTPAAERALAEAEERRRAAEAAKAALPPEKGGRNGPEPVRYGDWEKNGIISDF